MAAISSTTTLRPSEYRAGVGQVANASPWARSRILPQPVRVPLHHVVLNVYRDFSWLPCHHHLLCAQRDVDPEDGSHPVKTPSTSTTVSETSGHGTTTEVNVRTPDPEELLKCCLYATRLATENFRSQNAADGAPSRHYRWRDRASNEAVMRQRSPFCGGCRGRGTHRGPGGEGPAAHGSRGTES